ncbi:MAG: hypothetical protein IPM06_19905 [Rhizobiales bacterium]|nr:hypothetical protein [Hyphomicrobiales bacterium]
MTNYHAEAIAAIEAADLTTNVYRSARRLLDLVGETGQCKISREDMTKLCGTSTDGTVRNHLYALQKAGIIHYSTNDAIHVSFVAYPTATPLHAQRDPARAMRDPARAMRETDAPKTSDPDDPTRAMRDPARAVRDPARAVRERPHTREDCLSVCLYTSSSDTSVTDRQCDTPKTPETADEPTPPAASMPPPEEQDRSIALLTDSEVGIDSAIAGPLAAKHRFEYLLRQVLTYRRQLAAGKVKGPGGLLNRINRGWGCHIVDADRITPLWKRHMSPQQDADDGEARRRNKYIPEEYADIIIG